MRLARFWRKELGVKEGGESSRPWEGFGERLRELIGGPRRLSEFARKCGLARTTLRAYVSRGVYPTVDKLARIVLATGADLNWLVFGRRSRLEEEFVFVPRVDVRLGAGGEVELFDVSEEKELYAFRRDWLLSKGNPKNMRLMTVMGDSMEPTLSDGDLVLVDLSRRDLAKEGIFAVRIHDGLAVKRLQRLGRARVRVISDNPLYPPEERDLENSDFEIIGRVIWAGRSFL